MRRMTCGNWLSDTSTPVCLDSWDQWRCLQWRFRGIARQAVQIISLVGVLVYPCLTSFWQWWSRRWETSDIFSFSLLLSNLIRDLTKACFFFLSFWPMGKCCFYFFHSRWKWKMPERQILKRKHTSGLSKHFVLINMPPDILFLTFIKDW